MKQAFLWQVLRQVCFERNWWSQICPSLEALRPAMQDGCDEFDKGMRR
jgi:hypothetical protein